MLRPTARLGHALADRQADLDVTRTAQATQEQSNKPVSRWTTAASPANRPGTLTRDTGDDHGELVKGLEQTVLSPKDTPDSGAGHQRI